MGIVSSNDFDLEKSKLVDNDKRRNTIPSSPSINDESKVEIIDAPNRGRGEGNVEVPNSLRQLIGEESVINGRHAALQLAKSFGVSESSVSAYSKGATSTATINTQPNRDAIRTAITRAQSRARKKMMVALNALTPEKIQDAKPRDIAAIAKDMSVIYRNLEPDKPKDENNGNTNNGVQFVFYNPPPIARETLETIVVKE